MGNGFRVDVEALKTAGLSTAELMTTLADAHVEDLDAAPEAVGHAELAAGLESFCDRWQAGLDNLTKDGEQLSRNLLDCAGTYLAIEQDLVFALGGSAEDLLNTNEPAPPPTSRVTLPVAKTGGTSVKTAELGQTHDPIALVNGNASAVTRTASSLQRYGQLLSDTGQSLQKLDSTGWEGQAGDAFREYFEGEPKRWIDGGDAFSSASTSLEEFAHTLQWAQDQAREAIRLWDEGEAATKKARAQHQAAANAEPPVHAAAAGSATPEPEAFSDPGEPLRAQAHEVLDRARTQLDSAGRVSASTVHEAESHAPEGRSLLDQVGDALETVGQALGAVGETIGDIPGNLIHNVLDTVADRGDAAGATVGAAIKGAGLLSGELHELGGEAAGTVLSSAGKLVGSQTLEATGTLAEALGDNRADVARAGTQVAGDAVTQWADGEADFVRQRADEAADALGAEDPTGEGEREEPHFVVIDPERFPKTSLHILQAQEGLSFHGDEATAYPKQQPSELTYDPPGNENNERRAEALRGIPARGKEGLDRDEYPPAVFAEGGGGSSVKYLPSSDNQRAGASMGSQMRSLDDGDPVRIVVG